MGKLNSDVINARENWLKHIDPINYFSFENESMIEKVSFSAVEYFVNLGGSKFIKDREIALINTEQNIDHIKEIMHQNEYLVDLGGHLSSVGYTILFEKMYEYIVNNNLVD